MEEIDAFPDPLHGWSKGSSLMFPRWGLWDIIFCFCFEWWLKVFGPGGVG